MNYGKHLIEGIVIIVSILGAFALDRWYETRSREVKLTSLLEKVMDEALYDMSELIPRIERNKHKIASAQAILNRDDKWHEGDISALRFAFSTIRLTHKSYDELLKISDQIPPAYDEVLECLNIVHGRFLARIQHSNDVVFKLRDDRKGILWKEKWYDEFRSTGELSEEGVKYIEENPEFRNLLMTYVSEMQTVQFNLISVYGLNLSIGLALKDLLGSDKNPLEFLPTADRPVPSDLVEKITGKYIPVDSTHQDSVYFINDLLFVNDNGTTIFLYHYVNDSTFESHGDNYFLQFRKTPHGLIESFTAFGDEDERHFKVVEKDK